MSEEKSAKSGQYVHKDNLSQDEMSQDKMSQDKTSQDKMSVRTKRLLVVSCEIISTTGPVLSAQAVLAPVPPALSTALWQSGDMGEKCNKKVVNFGN